MSPNQVLLLTPALKRLPGCPLPPPTCFIFWSFSMETSRSISAVAIQSQALSASGPCYWGFFPPLASPPPTHPHPLASYISQSPLLI